MEIDTLFKKKILRECIDFDINESKQKLAVIQLKDLDNSLYYMINVFGIDSKFVIQFKDVEDPDIILLKCPLGIRFIPES